MLTNIRLDPGSAAEDTGGFRRFISAAVTMCGIFIISILIGVLTTGMEGKLAELRKGRTQVIETNHTSRSLRCSKALLFHLCSSYTWLVSKDLRHHQRTNHRQ